MKWEIGNGERKVKINIRKSTRKEKMEFLLGIGIIAFVVLLLKRH